MLRCKQFVNMKKPWMWTNTPRADSQLCIYYFNQEKGDYENVNIF